MSRSRSRRRVGVGPADQLEGPDQGLPVKLGGPAVQGRPLRNEDQTDPEVGKEW